MYLFTLGNYVFDHEEVGIIVQLLTLKTNNVNLLLLFAKIFQMNIHIMIE